MSHTVALFPMGIAAIAFVAAWILPSRLVALDRFLYGSRSPSFDRFAWWMYTTLFCLIGIVALVIGVRILTRN